MAKKEKIAKTNATRLLEQTRVAHRVVTYEVDPDDLSAEHLAETAGLDIEVVYKTLVLHGEKVGHFVAVIPGGKEVDLKVAATAAGAKKAAKGLCFLRKAFIIETIRKMNRYVSFF